MKNSIHESHMRWAIALALEGAGKTSPNPMVGAVIVKGGRIVGEGYHHMAGTPHAEIHALRGAGRRARGADMYVTMEPCCHDGRTPPCVDAIVEAGVKRVYIGTRDPNPIVDGRGIRQIEGAGIRVEVGILEESCRAINEVFNKFIVSGVPHVTAKVAVSLDGKIATPSGDSKWITNAECRKYVHRLRGMVDAVVIGGGTSRKDNPRLDVRLGEWRGIQPRAVIIDETLNLPRNLHVLKRRRGHGIFVTTSRSPVSRRRWIEGKGHEVILCRATSDGRVFLPHMLRELGRRDISSVLVEGGGRVFADFMKRKLIDRLVVCLAPKLIGGDGLDFLPGISVDRIKDAFELRETNIRIFGDNVVVEGMLR